MALLKKHPVLILLILGFILRFALIFLDYSWDVNNHITWASDLWQRGPAGFYETSSSQPFASLYPNYPPLALFIFYLIYPLQSIIYRITWFLNIAIPLFPSKLIFFIQGRSFLAGMLKLPAIIADLGIALTSYFFAVKIFPKRRNIQLITLIFILFNPAFFYNSAYWGQIDAIPLFFIMLSCYILIYSNRYITSGILFMMAFLVKPTIIVFLPVYLVFFIRKYGINKFILMFIITQFIFCLAFLPFFKKGNIFLFPYFVYYKKIILAQSLPFVTNGAFNFWVLITQFKGIKDTAIFLLGMSYRVWAYLMTGFITLIILLRVFILSLRKRGYDHLYNFFYAGFLIVFAAFLFLTKMHERYSLLPLPFLLLAAIENRKLLRWYIVLSLVSLINLYHSWPVPRIDLLTAIISNSLFVRLISLFNVVLFFYLLINFFEFNRHDRIRRHDDTPL